MRVRRLQAGLAAIVCCGGFLAAASPISDGAGATSELAASKGQAGKAAYLVYWDQNEEVDFLSMPSGDPGPAAARLGPQRAGVRACPTVASSGGYDPTLPGQHNLGSAKPYKQPADGEELDDPNGSFSGQTLYVPGPLQDARARPSAATRRPTADGVFNNNQTYTGCAVDKAGNVFGNDIATAQGRLPAAEQRASGGVVRAQYTTYCIVYGPTAGGVGPHHTDGTGGLAQPGMMALADNGDLLVPNVGTSSVLRFAASSLPTAARTARAGIYPREQGAHVGVREERRPSRPGWPRTRRVTASPSAATSAIPAIRWVTNDGQPEPGRGTVPGTTIAELGQEPRASTTPSAWPSPPTGPCTSSTSTSPARGC